MGPATDTGCLWAPATSTCASTSTSTSCGSGGQAGERVHGPSTQQRRQQQGRRSSAVTDELPAEPTDSFLAFIRGVQQEGSSGSSTSSSGGGGSGVTQPVPAADSAASGAQQQQKPQEVGQETPASLPATEFEAALLSLGSADFTIAAGPSTCHLQQQQPLLERWRQAMHSMLPSPAPTAAKPPQGRGVLRAGAGRQLPRQGKGLANDAAEDVQPKGPPPPRHMARLSADENHPVLP
jgi:hypothetical protein